MKMRGSPVLKLCLCLVAVAAVAAASTPPPSLTASPGAVTFEYSSGEQEPLPVFVTVIASDGSSPVLSVVLTPPTGTAATLFPQPSVDGDTIQVGYNVSTLTELLSQPGAYKASLAVSAAGFPQLTIPLTFIVGTAVSIAATPSSLTFSAPSVLTPQTVALSSTDGAQISFQVASDSTWLSATASVSYTPSVLTVTVSAVNLTAGIYEGNITVTPSTGGILTIPVTLQVGTNTLVASPTSLAFVYTLGGTTPVPQAVQLSSLIANNTYAAQATSTGNWLLLNGVTTVISGTLNASLNVTVNPAGLAAGSYQGAITATDADGSTQTVTVTLLVSSLSNVANPTSLVFVAQAAMPAPATPAQAPAPQRVSVLGTPDLTYTATVTPAGGWLSVSPASGAGASQLTVTANPGILAPGTYTGTVQIDLNTLKQNIQVTLIVSANPVLTTTPGDFIDNYYGGDPLLAPLSLEVNVSSGPGQSFAVAGGVPPWLQIGSQSSGGQTPIAVTATLAAQTLPTGTYLAQIILIPTAAGGIPVVVPVLLTVENATPIVANVASLSFSGAAGTGPQNTTVEVTAAAPTSFTASTSTASGGKWLSVSPASGNASVANTPLTVTADATNLAKGTYQGTVTLTTAVGVETQIPVTFTVTAPSGPVTISPSTLAFAYTLGGALPAAQTLQITGTQSFTAGASTSGGGTWLAVTPTSGTGNTALSVSVNPADLSPGAYNGAITVTPTGGLAQTVAVTLTVSVAGSLTLTSSPPVFTYTVGDAVPAAQTLSVVSTGQAVTFTVAATSSGWLSVTPTSATTPANLSVSVNPANLGPGSYTGSVALSADGGTLQLNVTVSLMVVAPFPVIVGVVNAASYQTGGISPGEIVTVFGTSLGPVTGVTAAISHGYIETTLANVQLTFNGYPAPILYVGAGQINAIAPYELAGASDVSVEATFGSARSNEVTLPVVAAAPGVFSDNATGQGGGAILDVNYNLVTASNPVSGGAVIQIFATGQGQTKPGGVDGLIEPLTLPLPAPLLTPGVTIGGVTATIQYAGAAPGLVAGALQINAYVPDGLPSGPAPLVVSFGGVDYSQAGITVAIK
jgi:uncharacterized protein (TIGR03437 family)